MKYILYSLTLAVVLLFANNANAKLPGAKKIIPKVTVGIKVGADFQKLTGNTWDNDLKLGYVGGAFVGVTKKKIGVQAEVLVNSAKFDISFGGGAINTLSLNIPVLFEYKIVKRLWIQAGPQFSSMLSAKNGDTDVMKSFNSTDFAGVIGVQAVLPFHFVVGARYVLGLTDIRSASSVTPTTEAWNNRSIQLYLGFRFL